MQAAKKVAVVTGTSARGIGFFTVLGLAKAGYTVHGTVREQSKGEPLLEEAKKQGLEDRVKIAILRDVSDSNSVEKAFKEVLRQEGHIDVLVNNSAISIPGAFEGISEEDFHEVYNTNVLGVILCTQQVLPSMRQRKSGTIINVSSRLGIVASPMISLYASSKWALEGISQGLHQELQVSLYSCFPPPSQNQKKLNKMLL